MRVDSAFAGEFIHYVMVGLHERTVLAPRLSGDQSKVENLHIRCDQSRAAVELTASSVMNESCGPNPSFREWSSSLPEHTQVEPIWPTA